MSSRVLLVAAFLFSVSLAICSARLKFLNPPLAPQAASTVWEVEAEVTWRPAKRNERLLFSIPQPRLGLRLIDESFEGDKLSMAIVADEHQRVVQWGERVDAGMERHFLYNAVLQSGTKGIRVPSELLKAPLRYSRIGDAEATKLFSELKKAFGRGPSLMSVRACVVEGICPGPDLFASHRVSTWRLAKVLAAVYNNLGYKAVVAIGFSVDNPGSDRNRIPWVRVKKGKDWKDVGVSNSFLSNRVVFWRYLDGKASALPHDTTEVHYSLQPAYTATFKTTSHSREAKSLLWRVLSLRNVPVRLQAHYRLLLLVPLSALVITVLRVFVGLPMFGTFMPLLFALSFREMGLVWGMSLLMAIVFLGLIARWGLRSLRLLFIPRVSATLTMSVLVILLCSRLSYELQFLPGLSVTLFPIIIITMTIERVSISLEEVGFLKSFILLCNSLVAAAVCHALISNEYIQHYTFTFPELLLAVLALILLCGRYSGYRVLELWRFRHFASGD